MPRTGGDRIDIPMPPGRQSSSKSVLGVAVIAAVAVASGAWIYIDTLKTESFARWAATKDELVRVKQENLGSRKDIAIIQKGLGDESKRYRIGMLSFMHPVEWTVDRMSDEGEAVFTDVAGDVRARLHCPTLETGFEAWEFTRTTKTVEKGGLKVVSELLLGKATEPGSMDLHVIMADVSKDGDSLGSCLMTSEGVPDRATFQRIHDSFKLAE